MSDDLDDLLRRTMKTLDDQVPSGYFEGLPSRTLARLEDSSMQTMGTTDENTDRVPPQDRDEDSGLHDIRSMASSAKMRISSRRISQPPPIDEDVLAASSGSWKAVALPEPAKMVSLPEIAAEDAAKSDRKSKKELKAERTSAKQIAQQAIAVETAPVVITTESKPEIAAPVIGARFAQQKKSKAGLWVGVTMGLAAAAGVGWYVSTQMGGDAKSSEQVSMNDTARPAAPPATQTVPVAGAGSAAAVAAPTPPADPAPEPAAAVATSGDAVATGMADEKSTDKAEGAASDRGVRTTTKAAAPKQQAKKDRTEEKPAETKAEPAKEPPKKDVKGGGEKEGEPSFDDLLKEANIQDKKPEKVKLEKKSLSGADIKKGMNAVAGKAQGCYAGTQGTAQVKLTVGPDGKVQKVAVTGVFAGTPVGACVESAVKNATFPPWDGGPQSFGFSYLLAE